MWFAFVIMMSGGKEEPSPYFEGSYLIFLAAERKKELLIFLLGGRKSLSQTLFLSTKIVIVDNKKLVHSTHSYCT